MRHDLMAEKVSEKADLAIMIKQLKNAIIQTKKCHKKTGNENL